MIKNIVVERKKKGKVSERLREKDRCKKEVERGRERKRVIKVWGGGRGSSLLQLLRLANTVLILDGRQVAIPST